MELRIGINGFGRMGRLALRAGWDDDRIRFVHVNEPNADAATSAHLLTFDSVHGRWERGARDWDSSLFVDGERLSYSREQAPGEIDWAAAGVDIVLEWSGRFRTKELLDPYSNLGVKKTQDWTEHHIVFNTLGNEKITFYVGCWTGTTGKLWIDDVALEESAFVNLIRRDACPLVVKNAAGDALVEGKDFAKLSDPNRYAPTRTAAGPIVIPSRSPVARTACRGGARRGGGTAPSTARPTSSSGGSSSVPPAGGSDGDGAFRPPNRARGARSRPASPACRPRARRSR